VNPLTKNSTTPGTSQFLELYDIIAADMAAVEQILLEEISSDFPAVHEMVSYGRLLGGKRLRPALLLLCGGAWGETNADQHKLAAVVEMVHTATLIHDDVLDKAETRRHRSTVHKRFGVEASVLTGDFLFTHAFYLASTLPTTYAAQKIGQATNIVCEGELRQITTQGCLDLAEEDYLRIIEAKTAVLTQCACELGAHYAGADEAVIRQAAEYGRCLGIAFQIVDDILDIDGESNRTGKTLGTDLQQQKPTLPLIHALHTASHPQQAELKRLIDNCSPSLEPIRSMFCELGSLRYAREKGAWFVDQALSQISRWPDNRATDSLRQMAGFVMKRCH